MLQSVQDWWEETVDPTIDRLFPDREVLGNNVERWLVAIGLVLVLWALFRIIKGIVRRRANTLAERSKSIAPWAQAVADVATATKLWFLFGLAFYLSSLILALPDRALSVLQSLTAIVLIVQAAIWGTKLIEFAITRYSKQNRVEDAASVTTMSALAFLGKLATWSVALLLVLDNLGVDVTALIAGLGVGGIAVALAAQNVLGDLFASLSIVMDKPFVLGDFIIVGDLMGTVENIGMKTTRLRSISGEQLVFPNSDLLGSRIRNFKRMQERRVVFGIGVTYQTALAKVQEIPELIKQAITSQEQIRFDRAHFKAFGDSALTFEAVYYVTTPDYAIYMDIQQQINFTLLEQFESQGIGFAYPTQTVHLQQASQNPSANS